MQLLAALQDPAQKIRTLALDFWDHKTRLETNVFQRLVEVFSTLWPSREQPELLESWLSSSSQLLLKLAQRSHQYEEVLFKDPLSECDFAAVQINTQGTLASSSMLPMFGAAFTQSTQDMSTQGDQASAQAGGVRATQDALFSQTQVQDDSDWSRRGNWDASQFGSTQSVGGDLFAPVGATQQAADYSSTQSSQGGGASQSTSLKKRFQGGVKQRSHIIRALQNKKRREKEFSERSKTMRSKAVQVLREYRQGELPDIQIKRRDILQPLMVVVAGDAEVAGITFGAMFDAIFGAKVFDKELEYGPEDMRNEIRQHLTNALGDAKVSYDVTQSLQRILLNHDDVSLGAGAVQTITESSLGSQAYHGGILLLEKELAHLEANAGDEMQINDLLGDLQKLYKQIGQQDVVLQIVRSISSDPDAQSAVETELRGDYGAAYRKYEALLNKMEEDGFDQEPSELEVELWEQNRAACMMNLCKWDELVEHVDAGLEGGSFAKLWDADTLDYLPVAAFAAFPKGSESNQQRFFEFMQSELTGQVMPHSYVHMCVC